MAPAGRDKRSGLHALLKGITRSKIDIMAAWSIRRLGQIVQ